MLEFNIGLINTLWCSEKQTSEMLSRAAYFDKWCVVKLSGRIQAETAS